MISTGDYDQVYQLRIESEILILAPNSIPRKCLIERSFKWPPVEENYLC